MPPLLFPIDREEIQRLKELQVRRHREWPAAFSTNNLGQIWLYTHAGKTPLDQREFVDGMLKIQILKQIAETYRYERPDGGRFFVDERGCFYRPKGMPEVQFIEFTFLDG